MSTPQNANGVNKLPPGKRRRLMSISVSELSLVDKGAVPQSRYVIAKRDASGELVGGEMEVAKAAGKDSEQVAGQATGNADSSLPAGQSSYPWENSGELFKMVATLATSAANAALADKPDNILEDAGAYAEANKLHPLFNESVSALRDDNEAVWSANGIDIKDPRQSDVLTMMLTNAFVSEVNSKLNWWRYRTGFVNPGNEYHADMLRDVSRKILDSYKRVDLDAARGAGSLPDGFADKALDAVKFGDVSPRDFGGSNVMDSHAQEVADAVVVVAGDILASGGVELEKAAGCGGAGVGGKKMAKEFPWQKGGKGKSGAKGDAKVDAKGGAKGGAKDGAKDGKKASGKKAPPFGKKPARDGDSASGKEGAAGNSDSNEVDAKSGNDAKSGKKKFPFAKAADLSASPQVADKGPDGKFPWENDENTKALIGREGARGVEEAMPGVGESDKQSAADMAAAGSLHPKLIEMRDKIRSFQPELWAAHGIDMNDPRQVEALDRHLHAAFVAAASGGGAAGDGMDGGADAGSGGGAVDDSDGFGDGTDGDGTPDGVSGEGMPDDGMDAPKDGADGMDAAGEGMEADASESADESADGMGGDAGDAGDVEMDGDAGDGGGGEELAIGEEDVAGGDSELSEDVLNAVTTIAVGIVDSMTGDLDEDSINQLKQAVAESGEIPQDFDEMISESIQENASELSDAGMDTESDDWYDDVEPLVRAAIVSALTEGDEDGGEGEDDGETEDGDAEDDGDGEEIEPIGDGEMGDDSLGGEGDGEDDAEEIDAEDDSEEESEDDGEGGDGEEVDDEEDDSEDDDAEPSLPAGLKKGHGEPFGSAVPVAVTDSPCPSSQSDLCAADQDAISCAVADAICCLRRVAHLLGPDGLNMLSSIMAWANSCCRPCDELTKAISGKQSTESVVAKSLGDETPSVVDNDTPIADSQVDNNTHPQLDEIEREYQRLQLQKQQREEDEALQFALQKLSSVTNALESVGARMEKLESRVGRVSGGKK